MMRAAYLYLLESGELERRAIEAHQRLENCVTCAWECRVNRLAGKLGICQTGAKAYVSSYGPHLGEEDPLRGWRGSGTIFFSRCNLRCQFCQNHDISQTQAGYPVDAVRLAEIMLELEAMGCHNINLVSPSHVVPQILEGLLVAAKAGLNLPLVYNSGGYDSLETLKLLDGVIDIYMPDMKYASEKIARHYSKIPHYPQTNQAAVLEMHRQVGDLQIDRNGIATRGLLVRHLVLPNDLAGTAEIVRFLAERVSTDTYLNVMSQYRPAFNARQFPKLSRSLKAEEHRQAVQMALAAGLQRLD
jgi:putative pyruvate formate lyase activating enzyme